MHKMQLTNMLAHLLIVFVHFGKSISKVKYFTLLHYPFTVDNISMPFQKEG